MHDDLTQPMLEQFDTPAQLHLQQYSDTLQLNPWQHAAAPLAAAQQRMPLSQDVMKQLSDDMLRLRGELCMLDRQYNHHTELNGCQVPARTVALPLSQHPP
eukprot:TRINITY_DN5775_c0_g1_i1.p1 TRINITY_DN5775_c0_g1~~TRINITY_DN5775_c0_g1_i1.p1  ORF type:complete len:101 (+),score=22.89 TRINITY_DN5775_c0_g1_i1:287-589(+)